MSKPILVTRLPREVNYDNKLVLIHDYLMAAAFDYNHIILRETGVDKVEFEVFNVQDYPQIDFDILKSKLESLNEPDKTIN